MRVLGKGKDTDTFHVRPTRNLINKLMLLGPVLLTMGVTVDSRTRVEHFDTVAASPEENALIEAYIEPVRAFERVIGNAQVVSANDVRGIAKRWVHLAEQKKLRPLEPVGFEDSTSDGVKSQIMHSVQEMMAALSRQSSRAIRLGDPKSALNDSILAVKVGNVLKYSDFASVTVIGMSERRALLNIARVLPAVDVETRQAAATELATLRTPKSVMGRMALAARRNFDDYQRRQNVDPVLIQETDRVVSDQTAFQREADLKNSVKSLREVVLVSRDNPATPILTTTRLGFVSELETTKRLDEAIVLAQSTQAPKAIEPDPTPPSTPSAPPPFMFQRMSDRRGKPMMMMMRDPRMTAYYAHVR